MGEGAQRSHGLLRLTARLEGWKVPGMPENRGLTVRGASATIPFIPTMSEAEKQFSLTPAISMNRRGAKSSFLSVLLITAAALSSSAAVVVDSFTGGSLYANS